MFVFLSKLLPIFAYPLGLACIFLIIGLILLLKKPRPGRAAVITALVILWVGGNRWVAASLTRGLEWQFISKTTIPKSEVIVLLGGGTAPFEPPRPMVEINGAGDRIIYAAQLYKQGIADHILVSGGNINWSSWGSSTPASEMVVLLEMLGVPEQALWIQDRSQNTREDAEFSKVILNEKRIEEIILVTSALHMPRSVALFEKQGFKVIPAPTDFKITQAGWENLWKASLESYMIALFPSTENLSSTSVALKEYIGLIIYRFLGWL